MTKQTDFRALSGRASKSCMCSCGDFGFLPSSLSHAPIVAFVGDIPFVPSSFCRSSPLFSWIQFILVFHLALGRPVVSLPTRSASGLVVGNMCSKKNVWSYPTTSVTVV